MTKHYTIGIDISKAHLDVHRTLDNAARQFENSTKGLAALKNWLGGPEQIKRIVYEPTGRYHYRLETWLCAKGYALAPVNPLQARHFAKASGTRAKTDRLDAAMLARMGQVLTPECREPGSEKHKNLKELQVARQALIKDRTAAKNRAKGLTLPLLKRQNTRRLKQIKQDMAAIETAMLEMIQKEKAMAQNLEILCSIPGISTITALALLVEMPELGTLEAKTTASLAGLAPIARESGRWVGKRFISGGRKHLREALYMPALVAIRFNPDMKTMYNRLKEKGKPSKVALTAIMRKLIILANTLIKQQRKWKNYMT